MKTFREYLDELRALRENPQHIEDFPLAKARKYFAKRFNDEYITMDDFEEIAPNIYMYCVDLHGKSRFLMYKDMEALVELKYIKINNGHNIQHAHEVVITSKLNNFSQDNKGVMYKLYSSFSIFLDTYIVSGKEQTSYSKKLWKIWMHDRKNIKEMFGYNTNTKKFIDYPTIENYWCKEDKCKDRRLVVKFKK